MSALEAKVESLMGDVDDLEDEMDSSDDEETEDEESEPMEKSKMKDAQSSVIASRAEILSPGIAMTKDIKVKALKAAYATTDGKAIIDSLTGGAKPAFDKPDTVDTLFVAASELMKHERALELSNTKKTRDSALASAPKGAMTPAQINALNAAHFGLKN